jgi:hypothetical protein
MSDRETCVYCRRDDHQVPLLRLSFRGAAISICPQHLPILIHDPGRLAGVLPGAEDLAPAEHHD